MENMVVSMVGTYLIKIHLNVYKEMNIWSYQPVLNMCSCFLVYIVIFNGNS